MKDLSSPNLAPSSCEMHGGEEKRKIAAPCVSYRVLINSTGNFNADTPCQLRNPHDFDGEVFSVA